MSTTINDPALFSRRVAAPRSRLFRSTDRLATTALSMAGVAWFVVAIAGQLLFATYITLFYGRAALTDQPSLWNKVMPRGYVPGDTVANLVLGVHLAFAAAIIVSGASQLIPQVRRIAPAIHRWNGRLYVLLAMAMGIGGLYMVATRNPVGGTVQHVGIGINAILIIAFAGLAWHRAFTRQFARHRRWALRLFLVVSGVWFFRISLMASIVVNHGPIGFDPKTFLGPFLDFLSFAQWLVPLAVLEICFQVRDRAGPAGRLVMAGALVFITLLTGLGIVAASLILWLPRLALPVA